MGTFSNQLKLAAAMAAGCIAVATPAAGGKDFDAGPASKRASGMAAGGSLQMAQGRFRDRLSQRVQNGAGGAGAADDSPDTGGRRNNGGRDGARGNRPARVVPGGRGPSPAGRGNRGGPPGRAAPAAAPPQPRAPGTGRPPAQVQPRSPFAPPQPAVRAPRNDRAAPPQRVQERPELRDERPSSAGQNRARPPWPVVRPGQAVTPPSGARRGPAAARARDFNDIVRSRQRRRQGGRDVIIESDDREIVRDGRRRFIRNFDGDRLGRSARGIRTVRRNGRDVTRVVRPNGVQILTTRDGSGRVLRRVRIGRDGRRAVLFTNRYRGRRRDRGGLSSFWLGLALPLITIPAYRYIVDSSRADYDDYYDALMAPPIDALDDAYTLDEVRYNYPLRARMRSIDINTIEFDTGSWRVPRAAYYRLRDLARAMRRVIRDNPEEMFLIEGHTDAVGSDDDNLSLSDRRAESVAVILSEEFAVPPENMVSQGYGEQFLRVKTPYAEQRNRRVTVRRITPLLARAEDGDDGNDLALEREFERDGVEGDDRYDDRFDDGDDDWENDGRYDRR